MPPEQILNEVGLMECKLHSAMLTTLYEVQKDHNSRIIFIKILFHYKK